MKGSNIVMDRNCDRPHYQSCREKTEGRQKEALAPRFRELALIHRLQSTTGNDRGEAAENRRNQDRQNPKTSMSPEHLVRCWHASRNSRLFLGGDVAFERMFVCSVVFAGVVQLWLPFSHMAVGAGFRLG